MSDSTPLRKYGKYRVRQIKRRMPFFELHDETCDDLDAAVVARSYCKASVEFVGERLGSGRMLATPQEYADAVISLYADWHACRFSHAVATWLIRRIGTSWINGGPVSSANTDTYSPAGRAWQRARLDTTRQEILECCGGSEDMERAHRKTWEESDSRDADIVRRFREGDWPDVLDGVSRELYYTRDTTFTSMIAANVSAEWVDVGREAMRLLLKYGIDGEYPMRGMLEESARRLEERFGGSWHP